ncbi:DUF5317 domain-containing protein [Frankia sp. AgB1.9]|uniref:DUF5317 domain-containing protein n=1 Tax=unclassified Frankia TaxID=2632575 RepID=UPI0019346118|nr:MULTISPECIES: DUF5317 domain-containing protein [unclassified Frankia]MBL7494175.1 DUF5317 domain-containing protein [Frankia sp. AgW1.1]MBL7552355.1 DUF5317 domain-containing protein [Frankia sp. AgB1.9]MBL7624495.1 DUF5317 domain-containing protein [Frankia sp. AgB1.8]
MFVLLVLALLVGLVIARLRGGTLDALGRVRVRLGWLAAVIVLALVVAVVAPRLQTVGWLVAAVLAAILSAANRRIPGLFLLFIGLALNTAAIGANHGRMPVSTAAISSAGIDRADVARSDHYVLADHDTRLRYLGDVIAFPFWGAPAALSAGDVLIASGIGLFAGLAPVRASRTLRARREARDRRRGRRQAQAAGDADVGPDAGSAAGRAGRWPVAALPAGPAAGVTPTPRRGTMAADVSDERHSGDDSERRSRHGEEEA